MQRVELGRSGLLVSRICLGTMTWGSQNTEAEAHRQLDLAVEAGIDFLDTAENYAIPPTPENQGSTERFIGAWLKARGRRHDLVIATKVAGRGGVPWIRGKDRRLDRANITAALEASLLRLGTDWIDLYQVHWPERATNRFGERYHQELDQPDEVPIEETLGVLGDLVRAGKIRAIGVSNETPWGVMRYLNASAALGLPRIATIQNPYNLLNRTFEIGLSEISRREAVGLLAYAPLAAGTLTGKYLDGALPQGSRRAFDNRASRYRTPNADAAVRAWIGLAQEVGLDPVHLALGFVLSRDFVACPILGATATDQLRHALAALNQPLSAEVLAAIETISARFPDPCP